MTGVRPGKSCQRVEETGLVYLVPTCHESSGSGENKEYPTYDETICGTAWHEGRLNGTKIEGNIGDLLDDIPVLVALIVIIRAECIYLAESRCKSLLRIHGEGAHKWQASNPAR